MNIAEHSAFLKMPGIPAALAWLCMWCGIADAASLDSMTSNWPQLNLRATLGTGASPEVEQGGNLQLRIAADEEAYVAIVLVNADGKAQVIVPRREAPNDRVTRGTEMLFPDLLAGEALYADMPVGKGALYVIGSDQAIFAAESGLPSWVSADSVRQRIAARMDEADTTRMAVRRLPLYVVAPQMRELATEQEFVQFFGVATRSVPNANRGFKIEFQHDSAALTDWSRRQLDIVSAGMNDKLLAGFRFRVEGHTDDVGTAEYNMDLSARRARSVSAYLTSKGVAGARLETGAMGESAPANPGTSEQARTQNRRVIIQRLGAGR